MRFRTNKNIFVDFDEYFDPNWMDSDTLVLPETKSWDYQREMTISDVDIWEVIYEQGGGLGVYAAYCPYAEFYMIRPHGSGGRDGANHKNIETYYGKHAQRRVIKRMQELNIPYALTPTWVEEEDMWLYK